MLFLEQVELSSLLSVKCKSRNVPTGSSSPSHSKGMTESLRRIKEEEENRRQQQQQRHQHQHYRREDDDTDDGDDSEDQPEQEERLQIHARIVSDDSVLTVDLDPVYDDDEETQPISPRVVNPEVDDQDDDKRAVIRHQPLADSNKQRAVVKNLRELLNETRTRSADEYRILLQDLQACIVDHIS